MRIAMSAAVDTVRTGVAQLDRGAAAVQRSFAVPTAPAPAPAPAAAPARPAVPAGGAPLAPDDLLSGMTQLLLSRTTVGAGVATARAADDAYRAVLDLGRR